MKSISLIFLIFQSSFLFSQNPLIKQWDYRYGGTSDEQPRYFQQTIDGGYVIGGFSKSDISGDKSQPCWGSYDYWVVKTDSMGTRIWDKRYGGTRGDYLISLQQT